MSRSLLHALRARASDTPAASAGDATTITLRVGPEQELLIGAQPELKQPYGWREMMTAGGCILGWYSVGISAIVTNKLVLRMPRFHFPFSLCLVYMFVKWPLARLVLYAMRRPPLAFSPAPSFRR